MLCKFGIVFIPNVRNIFSLVPLNGAQWGIIAAVSLVPIIIMEGQKKLDEIVFGRPVYDYKEVRE